MKTLKLGSNDGDAGADKVNEFQQLLQELNLNPGSTNGVFDEQTEASVKEFQRQQNITEDGIVGPETWEKLIEAISFQDYSELNITTPITAEVCFKRGVIFERGVFFTSDSQKAMENFKKAIQLNPNFAQAYYQRGLLYSYSNDFSNKQQAEKDFSQAIRCNSDYTEAYLDRGFLRYERQEKQRAIDDWTEVIRINPKNGEAYYRRAIAREELGAIQEAIEDYRQVFQIWRGVSQKDVKEVIQDLQLMQLESVVAHAYYRGVARYYLYVNLLSDPTAIVIIQDNNDIGISYNAIVYRGTGLDDWSQTEENLSQAEEDLSQAVKDLSQAIELAPSFADAYYYRGRVHTELLVFGESSSFTRAIDDFTQAIQLNPKLASAYYYLGRLQTDKNKQLAIEYFSQAIQLNQNFALAYYYRGLLYSKVGDEQRAIDDFKNYLCLEPDMTEATRSRLGLGVFEEIPCSPQKVPEDYLKSLQVSPDDAEAYTKRGKLRSWLGDSKGAIKDFTQAIEHDPDFAEAYYYRGLIGDASQEEAQEEDFHQRMRIAQEEDFTRAIEHNPDFAEAYFERGCVRYKTAQLSPTQGNDEEGYAIIDTEEVIADFTQAININPYFVDAYSFRGYVRIGYSHGKQLKNKDFTQEAIEDFQSCIRINPYFYLAYAREGYPKRNICPFFGDYQAAIADLSNKIHSNPEDAKAYFNRGILLYNSGAHQGAIADFTEVIRINPENADAYYGRGVVHYILRDYAKAIEDFTQAIGLDPIFADLYALRGLAYYDSGDLQAAIKDCNQAIWLDPYNANALFIRACSNYHLGRLDPHGDNFLVAVLTLYLPFLFPYGQGGGAQEADDPKKRLDARAATN